MPSFYIMSKIFTHANSLAGDSEMCGLEGSRLVDFR